METLSSSINSSSPDFKQNSEYHRKLASELRDRLARVRRLIAVAPGGEDGAAALAKAAIEARDWKMAREAIDDHVSGRPRARICMLMAEIEEGEFGDKGRAREWLARAVIAPRDPAWVADGYLSERWLPVSPVTDELGAFVWKAPLESLAYSGPAPEAIAPVTAVIEARPEPLPPPPPRRSDPLPKPRPRPEARPPAPAKQPPAPAPSEAKPVRPMSATASETAAARQPDDPGPDAEAERAGWAPKPAEG